MGSMSCGSTRMTIIIYAAALSLSLCCSNLSICIYHRLFCWSYDHYPHDYCHSTATINITITTRYFTITSTIAILLLLLFLLLLLL